MCLLLPLTLYWTYWLYRPLTNPVIYFCTANCRGKSREKLCLKTPEQHMYFVYPEPYIITFPLPHISPLTYVLCLWVYMYIYLSFGIANPLVLLKVKQANSVWVFGYEWTTPCSGLFWYGLHGELVCTKGSISESKGLMEQREQLTSDCSHMFRFIQVLYGTLWMQLASKSLTSFDLIYM